MSAIQSMQCTKYSCLDVLTILWSSLFLDTSQHTTADATEFTDWEDADLGFSDKLSYNYILSKFCERFY